MQPSSLVQPPCPMTTSSPMQPISLIQQTSPVQTMSPIQPPFLINIIVNQSVSMRPLNATTYVDGSKEQTCVSPSSQDCGFRRLLPEGVMELKADDKVFMVIPIDRDVKGSTVKINRVVVKDSLKKRIISARRNQSSGLSGIAKDKKFDDCVREEHAIWRDGKLYCEFAVCIITFPYHDRWIAQVVKTFKVLLNAGVIAHYWKHHKTKDSKHFFKLMFENGYGLILINAKRQVHNNIER